MTVDFTFEFLSEIEYPDDEMRTEAERRLRELTEGHSDITGASVAIEEVTSDTTPHLYEARVIIYIRPENLVAVEKGPEPMPALRSALSAVERRVREQRTKLRERWRQP